MVLGAAAVLSLAGCSSNEIDPDDLPAELVSFEPTIKVRKLWSKGVGSGTENLRLALRPRSRLRRRPLRVAFEHLQAGGVPQSG